MMSTSTWTGDISSDWADPDNWSPTGVPGAGSDVTIASGTPLALASASIGTVNSITDSSHLVFESAGTNTVATSLDDAGHLHVDAKRGEGGTILNIGAALTNSGDLVIGNTTLSASDEVTAAALDNTGKIYLTGSSADQALLDIAGSAGFGTGGILSGYARLAGDSAIEFGSGEITSLAASAHLGLIGSDAFIEDSSATGSNSALKGLASIGKHALFALHDGAAVSTTGALVNDGHVYLDPHAGDGGSSLTLAGALTNSGTLGIGNTALSASDKVTATALTNTGKIQLTGSGANQALLDVTGSAGFGTAGVLSGTVTLGVDSGGLTLGGNSAIEFASGQITSLANGAELVLIGNNAFIEDSTALGSNSAVTGLASVGAGATFGLENGASVSTTGALVNDGNISLEPFRGVGGSTLSIAGALTNNSTLEIQCVSAPDKLTVASLDNSGLIELGAELTNQALLDVTGSAGFGAAGDLSGTVALENDSAIEFASGEITSLAQNAHLYLNGSDAFIEDSTALGSNSALTGLASIGAGATLDLGIGASLSTTGPVTNSGVIGLDTDGFVQSGSTLSIDGGLTNTGALNIGTGRLSASDSLRATSFDNSGTVELTGKGKNLAALNVPGATTNNGSISIATDTEELAGAVGGTGSFSLSSANLQFDSSVSSGQTITETGADALTLNEAQSFAATISGFGTGDTIDATNFLETATSYNFVENSMGTGGTLTLHDAGLTANILMTGHYSNSDFTLAPDSGTGTLVKFV